MGFLMPVGVITGLGLLVLVGAMGKSAQVPLMVWLPDAMAGPTPVSAQIHAATMVTAGVYLLMRMFPLIGASPVVLAAIAVTGGVTAFYGATCAVAQRDLKRILAFSTISQIGYMMLGVGAGAITAATFHLIVHAFFKALLFLGAGCVITALHHEQDIFRMGGLRRTLPSTFWPFLAGALCLAGLPLTGGFFSKDGILAAVWLQSGPLYLGLYGLGLLTALLTAFYTFRMIWLVFGGTGPAPHRLPPVMTWMLVPLAILGLGGGLLNVPEYIGEGLLSEFMTQLSGKGHHLDAGVELALQGVAALIALTGLGLAWLRYGAKERSHRLTEAEQPATGLTAFLLNGWYVDDLYRVLFIRPFEKLSRFLWEQVDEGIIDDSLDRLATLLGRTGQVLGRWTCGRVSVYLLSLAAGAAFVLVYVVWVVVG
jgi:NADH-quinone oxidoreductase subunit L